MAESLIFRETIWQTELGDELQFSFAVLDPAWDLRYEATYPLGPFHTIADARLQAHDDFRRHLRLYGLSLELELG